MRRVAPITAMFVERSGDQMRARSPVAVRRWADRAEPGRKLEKKSEARRSKREVYGRSGGEGLKLRPASAQPSIVSLRPAAAVPAAPGATSRSHHRLVEACPGLPMQPSEWPPRTPEACGAGGHCQRRNISGHQRLRPSVMEPQELASNIDPDRQARSFFFCQAPERVRIPD